MREFLDFMSADLEAKEQATIAFLDAFEQHVETVAQAPLDLENMNGDFRAFSRVSAPPTVPTFLKYIKVGKLVGLNPI